jgi:hypothetical protein
LKGLSTVEGLVADDEDSVRWRLRAADLRARAKRAQESEIAKGFLLLATEYDKLAEQADYAAARWAERKAANKNAADTTSPEEDEDEAPPKPDHRPSDC